MTERLRRHVDVLRVAELPAAAAGALLIRYLQNQQESVADMVAEIRTAVAYFQSELGAGSAGERETIRLSALK